MASTNLGSGAILQSASTTQRTVFGRDRLARMVVVGSFLAIFLLAGAIATVAYCQSAPNDPSVAALEKAFNAILPVLAGWVGTVLAFYFSAASQERTNAMLESTIGMVAGREVLREQKVSEKMLSLQQIHGVRDLAKIPPKQVFVSQLSDDFSGRLPNGGAVTRLIFLENGVFKYVLHASTLNAHIAKAQAAGAPIDSQTLDDLINDAEVLKQISKLVVFMPVTGTVREAKVAMDRVSGAQDIIVTATGNATEPLLGWLTNVDLTKALG